MGERTDLRNIFREYLSRPDATDPNRVWSDEEIDEFIKQRQEGLDQLNKATESAEEKRIKKILKSNEEEYIANEPARRARKAKEAAMQAERLPLDEWKKQYPQHLASSAENMADEVKMTDDYLSELKRAAKLEKLKSLARAVPSLAAEFAKESAVGMLYPSDTAPSEMPSSEEDIAQLEAEMKMKNAPQNYPTKYNALRKVLGR